MKKIKILNIVGVRPNFMKIAPLFRAYRKYKFIKPVLVHTGQHSSLQMSGTFFRSLNLPEADYHFKIKKGNGIKMISNIMSSLQLVLEKERPDIVVVVGDVNSTLAGALTANKLNYKVAHVEAGLRSKDLKMPEEINRILVDHLSQMLFVSEKSGLKNLEKENISFSKIFLVGNVMIDNLIQMMPKISESRILNQLKLEKEKYVVVTMHRPSNVDCRDKLGKLVVLLNKLWENTGFRIIFPIHPRTAANLKKFKLMQNLRKLKKLSLIKPLDYIDFIKLIKESKLLITDSGGIQEEAAYLKIPVITLRENTERPSTVDSGSNVLCNLDNEKNFLEKVELSLKKNRNLIKKIKLNDGKAADRIVMEIIKKIKK